MEDDWDLYEGFELASELLYSLPVFRDRAVYIVWHTDDEGFCFFLTDVSLYIGEEETRRNCLPCEAKSLNRVGESSLLSSVVEGDRAHRRVKYKRTIYEIEKKTNFCINSFDFSLSLSIISSCFSGILCE